MKTNRVRDIVILGCFGLGAIVIISTLLKTWLGTSSSFDWYGLALGVFLCGLSLFRRVAVSKEGVTIETRDVPVEMDEAIKRGVPDSQNRALLILINLVPPKLLEEAGVISAEELARRVEEAMDSAALAQLPDTPGEK